AASAPISPKASTPTPCTAPTAPKPRAPRSPTSFPRPRSSPGSLSTQMSVNLLDLDGEALTGFVAGLGEKAFRARQLKRWIHRQGEADFSRMSDIARSLRDKLQGAAVVEPPRIASDSVASDGTRKWLLDVGNGNAVEAVFIPEAGRG